LPLLCTKGQGNSGFVLIVTPIISLAVNDNVVGAQALLRTPTSNRDLPLQVGGFETLAAGLDYAARGVTGYNFYSGRGALDRVLPYAELRHLALSTARKLLSAGLKRLDRVAIVAETGADFMITFYACQYAGLVPCPVPYSMYIGGRDAYVARISGMLKAASAHAIVTPPDMLDSIKAGAAAADVKIVLTHDQVAALPESITKLSGFAAKDVAYIQYSSGSTSAPKGVLISQRAIIANAKGMHNDGIHLRADDRGFSWLPFYHDMGLVGFCLAPMLSQTSVDYLATTAFARRPALWLKLMSENRSTVSFSPTFGYDLAAKRIKGDAAALDLSAWRVAGIGGDMVRPDVLNAFAKAMAGAKFDSLAFSPSYGMAESTLAISFSGPDKPVRVDRVSIEAVRNLQKAVPMPDGDDSQARGFVICGKPIAGHAMQVRNETGAGLKEREIGRIFVSGPSLMTSYFNNPEATADTIGLDGFLDTGDMGYMLLGEIVITGRAKDLILHNGRNIWPQDIEWSAEQLPSLKSGDVAAFAVEGSDGDDEVVVLVECRASEIDLREALRKDVGKIVHQSAGVDCVIHLVAPRSLPFTSSGKLSRNGARQKYLAGEMEIFAAPEH
jgi:fatty-acyl-CoA synthase